MLELRWEWLTARGLDVPGEARKEKKAAFYVVSAGARKALDEIRLPRRPLIFNWHLSESSFYTHYERLLERAKLPTSRKYKPQRVRRSSLTYWAIAGQDAAERAKHSDPSTTAKYYLDETLFEQPDPSKILPPIE